MRRNPVWIEEIMDVVKNHSCFGSHSNKSYTKCDQCLVEIDCYKKTRGLPKVHP